MRIPVATYRLQFNHLFTFTHARGVLDFLRDLGISDIYASPLFAARRGSLHGYDTVDFTKINPELGGEDDFVALRETARDKGLGWLQDFVPNHMAYCHENRMLMDVFEEGSDSRFFHSFDIEWDHPHESLRGRALAPFLGTFYGESLEAGEIRPVFDGDGLGIAFYDQRYPLRAASYRQILGPALAAAKAEMGSDHPQLSALGNALGHFDTAKGIEKARTDIVRLANGSPAVRACIDRAMKPLVGTAGDPASFDRLDELLTGQLYRLAFWKVAAQEINYRRFFVINDLISLRVERPEVFAVVHNKLLELIRGDLIDGIRIDHIDGLYDPADYLGRVRREIGDRFMIVEKILDIDEELCPAWPVQGTTGYDFLNHVNGLFCRQENQAAFSRIYYRFTRRDVPFESLVAGKKRLTIERHMAGNIHELSHMLLALASRDRHGRDIMPHGLERALVEIMVQFPVYRTYISGAPLSDIDRRYVTLAGQRAMERFPGIEHEVRFILKYLLLDLDRSVSDEEMGNILKFIMRFQQFTGPLMAKGFEDTTLYIFNRLISLNEVGGRPDLFGISLERFHAFNRRRAELSRYTLNATATHDTKRGEDVRARINVLSEIPREWERNIASWSRTTRRLRKAASRPHVDPNDEIFLYQTLVGAYPFNDRDIASFAERMKGYVVKALREATVHTAWIKPDTDYENACVVFVEKMLQQAPGNRFLADFLPFQKTVAFYGAINSLSQVILKITSPGIPDIYQGCELWDLALVDPDNRRPVDFAQRESLLREIGEGVKSDLPRLIRGLLDTYHSGAIKLFLIRAALQFRARRASLFMKGAYAPVEATGEHANNVIAFLRTDGHGEAITVAPRYPVSLVKEGTWPLGEEVWGDTRLAISRRGGSGGWRNVITGETVEASGELLLSKLLQTMPVALLSNAEDTP